METFDFSWIIVDCSTARIFSRGHGSTDALYCEIRQGPKTVKEHHFGTRT